MLAIICLLIGAVATAVAVGEWEECRMPSALIFGFVAIMGYIMFGMQINS